MNTTADGHVCIADKLDSASTKRNHRRCILDVQQASWLCLCDFRAEAVVPFNDCAHFQACSSSFQYGLFAQFYVSGVEQFRCIDNRIGELKAAAIGSSIDKGNSTSKWRRCKTSDAVHVLLRKT